VVWFGFGFWFLVFGFYIPGAAATHAHFSLQIMLTFLVLFFFVSGHAFVCIVFSFFVSFPPPQLPLHYAAHSGNAEMCALLVRYGADPDVANRSGATAREMGAEDRQVRRVFKEVPRNTDSNAKAAGSGSDQSGGSESEYESDSGSESESESES
jgi:hypothetical protein